MSIDSRENHWSFSWEAFTCRALCRRMTQNGVGSIMPALVNQSDLPAAPLDS